MCFCLKQQTRLLKSHWFQRDLVLAKFSCLALRRIGGSEKKVKGSLSDKSVRLPMDSPIFSCLRDLLEIRTQNREW